MKNTTSLKMSALICLWTLLGVSCSSVPTPLPQPPPSCQPREIASTPPSHSEEPAINFTERTFEIDASENSMRLYYPFRVCTKSIAGICIGKWVQVRMYYDMLDQPTKMRFKNADVVCRVRDKP